MKPTKSLRLEAAVLHYENVLKAMQDYTFYREDDEGVLRRWPPPKPLPERFFKNNEDAK